MGSQAAALAFAAKVVGPRRSGASNARRITCSAGDHQRRVSCAGSSSSRGTSWRNGCRSQKKATSTARAGPRGTPHLGLSGSRTRSSQRPTASDRDDVNVTSTYDDEDVAVDVTEVAEPRTVSADRDSTRDSTITTTGSTTPPAASSSSSRVVEFVAAWDALSPRLAAASASGTNFVPPGGVGVPNDARGNREMLLGALKLAIPRLQAMPVESVAVKGSDMLRGTTGTSSGSMTQESPARPAHERAVSVTLSLVDVGMDAECMSAGLLRDALIAGAVSLDEIEQTLGSSVMRLTHDCVRLQKLPGRIKTGMYDDVTAEKLRTFCLSFHDVRAVVVELAYRADALRNSTSLSKVQRTALALETMQLYAPMAHALDAGKLCAELEDLALRELFPTSYKSLERWLRNEGPVDDELLEKARQWTYESLCEDPGLMTLVGGPIGITVKARRKSLFSTMRKVLRDGRPREDVHDLLGMRVIVTPQVGSPAYDSSQDSSQDHLAAERSALAACYRVREITHSLFDTISGRSKDYLRTPKSNGYRSLHSTLKLPKGWEAEGTSGGDTTSSSSESDDSNSKQKTERRVELQVRTASMHFAAEMGAAAHAAYKGGFSSDPGAADALAELVQNANAAATARFGMYSEAGLQKGLDGNQVGGHSTTDSSLFAMFDLDGDGRVTRDELRSVIGDVWSTEENHNSITSTSDDLLAMLDTDSDGTISAEEFKKFRASVSALSSLPNADAKTAAVIEGAFIAERTEVKSSDDEVLAEEPEPSPQPTETTDEDGASNDAVEDTNAAVENALAALAASQKMSPPLPPPPPPPRIRQTEDAIRDAGRALRDKTAGPVEWQLVWDLQRAGKPETAREIFYQRTSKTPGVTALWEQWARFELLQGDSERARGLFRAALLHAEGRPRARAESLRKWAVMEFGAGDITAASGLFDRALRVLGDAELAARSITEDDEGFFEELTGRVDTEEQEDSNENDSSSYQNTGIPIDVAVESASSLRKAQAAVLSSWAQVSSRAGDCDNARELLQKAIACDSSNPRVLHSLGRLDELIGDYTGAVEKYEKILSDVAPGDAFASLSLAKVLHERLGDVHGARTVFTAAAQANPGNYKVLQAWALMEANVGGGTKSTDGSIHADSNSHSRLAGLAVARPLFQRASVLAPWSAHVWCAWAQSEWRATQNPNAARELYGKALEVEPTNVLCLRGLGEVERVDGRFSQARDYLERALDLEPRNRVCVKELAKLETEVGNKARAARYFNVAKTLLKESKAEQAMLREKEGAGVKLGGGSKGKWAPAEASAAARGVAAANAAKGASYRRADSGGGEAGGGKQGFRSVLAAARGEAAAVRRDKGGGVAGVGGEIVARKRVKSTWRRGDTDDTTSEKNTSDTSIGSSLDGIASSLDDDLSKRTGRNGKHPHERTIDMDAEFDEVAREKAWVSFGSTDEQSIDGTVDSMDDDLRRYTGEGR